VKITDPFNFTSPNFQPATNSPVNNASYWYVDHSAVQNISLNSQIKSFPNPFVGETNIVVDVKNESKLTINIYNSMGKNVGQLFNGKVNAGNHSFQFDATALPKGMYLGVITVDQSIQTIKMVAR
jgi:hypothetical protein